MKIYKHKDGRCNASGPQIKALREAAGLSQELSLIHISEPTRH